MLVGLFVGFGVARGFVGVSIAFLGGFVGSGHAVGMSASLTWCLPVGGLLSLLAYVLCFGFGADSVLLG